MALYPYASSLIMGLNGAVTVNCGDNLGPIFTGMNSYTVEAWVRFSALSGTQIIACAASQQTSQGVFMLELTNGQFGSFRNSMVTSVTTPVAGQWYHVATTFDGESALLSIYVDGYLEVSAFSRQAVDSEPLNFMIGGMTAAPFNLSDSVRNVSVWSTCRTQEEIWEDMNAYSPESQEGLEAWYNFQQSPIADISGKNQPATVTGTFSPYVETTCLQLQNSGYGECGTSDSLNIQGTTPFTLEALVYMPTVAPPSADKIQAIISRYEQEGSTGQYSLGLISSTFCGGRGESAPAIADSYANAEEWYQVAVTYNGQPATSNNQPVKLYVNGVAQVTGSNDDDPNPALSVNTMIGTTAYDSVVSAGCYFAGYIAYARIWNVCRTADEIQQAMNQDPLNADGLVANYDFSSMVDIDDPEYDSKPRIDLTGQNTVLLKGDANITQFNQPIPLSEVINVPTPPNTQHFTTYVAPPVSPDDAIKSLVMPEDLGISGDPFTEELLQKMLGEYKNALPADAENRKTKETAFEQKLRDLFARAKTGPDALRGKNYVKWHDAGERQILKYHTPTETTDILSLATNAVSKKDMLVVEFVATIVFGILSILGLSVLSKNAKKLGDFILNNKAMTNKIISMVTAGGVTAITGGTLMDVFAYLFSSGFLKKIIFLVVNIGFWTLAMFCANLAVTLAFPGVRAAQILVSFAVMAIHLIAIAVAYINESEKEAVATAS